MNDPRSPSELAAAIASDAEHLIMLAKQRDHSWKEVALKGEFQVALSALLALAERRTRVKRLEWKYSDELKPCWSAETIFGRVTVHAAQWQLFEWDGPVSCSSFEDGKQQAQKWYDDKIAPALEPDPEREAMRAEARDYAEAIDNVRQVLGLESTHWMVIHDEVRERLEVMRAAIRLLIEDWRKEENDRRSSRGGSTYDEPVTDADIDAAIEAGRKLREAQR